MRWSQLPSYIARPIALKRFGLDDADLDNPEIFTEQMKTDLGWMSPDELFATWLHWEGIINYSESIHSVHEKIYETDMHVAMIRSLKELYETCDSEYPEDNREDDYPQIVRAKKLLDKLEG
jgi:hemerythrin superfamily protein